MRCEEVGGWCALHLVADFGAELVIILDIFDLQRHRLDGIIEYIVDETVFQSGIGRKKSISGDEMEVVDAKKGLES